jgi:hypothetical protein
VEMIYTFRRIDDIKAEFPEWSGPALIFDCAMGCGRAFAGVAFALEPDGPNPALFLTTPTGVDGVTKLLQVIERYRADRKLKIDQKETEPTRVQSQPKKTDVVINAPGAGETGHIYSRDEMDYRHSGYRYFTCAYAHVVRWSMKRCWCAADAARECFGTTDRVTVIDAGTRKSDVGTIKFRQMIVKMLAEAHLARTGNDLLRKADL